MLTEIHINNLITIPTLHLDINSGTTVITGETGAGKSILIDAIELALGSRASNDKIRPGQEKAEISICFDVSKLAEAKQWLDHYDLSHENNACILRRVMHQDGRSKSFINGMPTTLQPLRELGELLIQIHGQHEYHSLLKTDHQRKILDHYASHQHLLDTVNHLSDEWHSLNGQITQLRQRITERNARMTFLNFQLQELKELQLTQDEFQTLDLEHKQLAHAGELLQNLNSALNILTDHEENNALRSIHQALHALELVQQVDPKISDWIESLNAILIQISDTEDGLRHYLNTIEIDPSRLIWVEDRISLLFNMARKHKINPQELYDLQCRLAIELQALENSDLQLNELEQKLSTIEKQYHDNAIKLSKSRTKAAENLNIIITKTIHELSLSHAQFEVCLEADKTMSMSPHGVEKIIFRIKTNAGQTMQPLSKIASGGELSRVGLAIHLATADQYHTPTLIFDEVDVGIGGGTAEMVGKLLRKLGQSHQVLCITHQAQVAAKGHHHLRVAKMQSEHSTRTHVHALSQDEKTHELARMLGGVEITQTTLAHAKELIDTLS